MTYRIQGFLALCREAGIPVKEVPRERAMKGQAGKATASAGSTASGSTRKSRASAGAGVQHGGQVNHQPVSGLVFGVTEDDLGVLSEEQFAEVWSALGTVAWARAHARSGRAAPDPGDAASGNGSDPEGG